jgi:hypothetical protein
MVSVVRGERRSITYIPVFSVAAIRLEREVVLNLLLQLLQVLRIQAFQDSFRIHDLELVVFHLVIQDCLGRIDKSQRDSEPVDGLRTTAFHTQRRLLLRLRQHEAVLVRNPGLFCCVCCVCRPLRRLVVRSRVGRALCRDRRGRCSALGQAAALVPPWWGIPRCHYLGVLVLLEQ